LEFCNKCALLEVIWGDEFIPMKNACWTPVGSSDTAKALRVALHKKWAIESGCRFEGDGDFEITPETSCADEELAEPDSPQRLLSSSDLFKQLFFFAFWVWQWNDFSFSMSRRFLAAENNLEMWKFFFFMRIFKSFEQISKMASPKSSQNI
jgi:hypothetical protein